MRLSSARVAVAVAAPSGVIAGHAIGYLAGDPHSGAHAVDHSYLQPMAALATPLLVAALAWAAVSGARSRVRPLPVTALLGAQWTLFAGQEMVEHTLAGHGPAGALGSPAVWLGLAAQALTAVALVVLLRVAALAGHRAAASPPRSALALAPVTGRAGPRSARVPRAAVAAAVPARGPPRPSPA